MARFVSQSTFDGVVQENMDDFDMTKEEALKDAVSQFDSQGASLNGIDTSGREDRLQARQALGEAISLLEQLRDQADFSHEIAIAQIDKIASLCRTGSLEEASLDSAAADVVKPGPVQGQGPVPAPVAEVGATKPQAHDAVDAAKAAREREAHASVCRDSVADNNGMRAVAGYVDPDELPRDMLLCALTALRAMSKGHERNRDAMYMHLARVIAVLKAFPGDAELVAAALAVVRVCSQKCESNKGGFVNNGGVEALLKCLRIDLEDGEKNSRVLVCEACGTIRSLCMGDDVRKDLSSAFENAKAFASKGAIPLLLAAARRYGPEGDRGGQEEGAEGALAIIFMALRHLAVSDEIVKDMVEQGSLSLLIAAIRAQIEGGGSILSSDAAATPQAPGGSGAEERKQEERAEGEGGGTKSGSEEEDSSADDNDNNCSSTSSKGCAVARAVVALFRNISGNDAFKTRLVEEGGLSMMLQTMQRYPMDFRLAEHGAATMAAMALRAPLNGEAVVKAGGTGLVIDAMQRFPTRVGLQRQGALCLRNIAARCVALREEILDQGAEAVLRVAGSHRGAVDEAYGALRDLGCEAAVTTRTVHEDGSVQVEHGVRGFGDKKANFSASMEESANLKQRVASEAKTPAQLGFRL